MQKLFTVFPQIMTDMFENITSCLLATSSFLLQGPDKQPESRKRKIANLPLVCSLLCFAFSGLA